MPLPFSAYIKKKKKRKKDQPRWRVRVEHTKNEPNKSEHDIMRANRCFDTINGVKIQDRARKPYDSFHASMSARSSCIYLSLEAAQLLIAILFCFALALLLLLLLHTFCSSCVHFFWVYTALSKRISSVLIKKGFNRKRRRNSNKSNSKQKMRLVHTIWPTE